MYKRSDREFFLDIFLACQKILEYTKGMSFSEFEKDEKTIDAVIRNIEILGEAVKHISKDSRERYPHVNWDSIARTRDKIIHFYFGIDIEVVRDIVNKSIPELFEKIKAIIKNEGWDNDI